MNDPRPASRLSGAVFHRSKGVRALVSQFDWSTTSLGPIATWPQPLTTAFDIIIETTAPMALLWGPNGVMIYNDAYAEVIGQRHPEILGRPVADSFPEITDFTEKILKDGFAGQSSTFGNQHLVLNRFGALEDGWYNLNYSPVRDSDGQVLGVLAVVIEVTAQVLAERKRLEIEQTLLERESELARVQRIGRVGGVEVDFSDGFRNKRSPEYLYIHGLPPEAATETHESWVARIHPDDREETVQHFLDAVKGDIRDYNYEYRIIRPSDGETRWVAISAIFERDRHGRALKMVGAHTDITARKHAEIALQRLNETLESTVIDRTRELRLVEESLRQAQKMEAIGQLTGGIAHDFNNLLTGIIGSLEVIKRRIDLGRVDDLDRFMDAAINSANRAASLTQRLLAFSRQQSLDLKPVNINALILSLEDLLRRSIGAAIELIVELPEDVWIVEGDTSQIESALLNLVINARDAMPDGGVIRIKAVNLSILESEVDNPKGLERGDYVLVSVADNGSGMSQAVIDRAFDPFFTTKPIGQGTGLGLSMVYGYARQSKGHVQIDSDKERGTTIRFYMRRHTGALVQEQIAVRSVVLPTGRGETVLVVEDEPAVRQLIVEILNETGYRTLEAADGPSAISVLQSPQHIDLLISDVGLPGMNGRQVAEIGRKHRPDLKVLFVTGYAQHAAVRSEFLGPGMQMITKPFQADVLLIRVREMIGAN